MQRLVVAGESVFVKMMHQQLLCLINCTCKEEGCNIQMGTVTVSRSPDYYKLGQIADTHSSNVVMKYVWKTSCLGAMYPHLKAAI